MQRKGNETRKRKREQRESDSWTRRGGTGRKRDDDGRRSNRGGSLGREITHTRPRLNIMRAMFPRDESARANTSTESERASEHGERTERRRRRRRRCLFSLRLCRLSIVALAGANARSCIVGAYCTHTRRCSQPRPRPTELA